MSRHESPFPLRVGQTVRYAYHAGAISCCQNGKTIKGEGQIDEIRPAGREPNVGIGRTWVFPGEIRKLIADPEAPRER